MNIIDARKMNAEEIAALLKKKAFDETELSPGVQAACDQMWGEHLTAAQIVDRIVDYVRRVGDEALLYFTNTIDRADLTAETLRVTEKEFDEARTLVDPKVVDSMTRAIMNVKKFHEEQMPKSWITNRAHG
ncbi:MAG: histidinol dehydrogenase, partial [Acidaminococcaceae bacterium]|nr:histidinol dehydrogenase [Acidaminococcaceae bacterium]